MTIETFTPTALMFTQGAANKVKSLIDEEANDRLQRKIARLLKDSNLPAGKSLESLDQKLLPLGQGYAEMSCAAG